MFRDKLTIFWFKANLPWRKLRALGAFMYGVAANYSSDGIFYIVHPEAVKVIKAKFSGQFGKTEYRWLEEIHLEKGLDSIGDFLKSTARPVFILDNSNLIYEILTKEGLLSTVNAYVLDDLKTFRDIKTDREKLRVQHIPRIVLSVKDNKEGETRWGRKATDKDSSENSLDS